MTIYTNSEKTVKKYTVGQAVESAKRRLKGQAYCANSVSNRDFKELITLKELNELSDKIVWDTEYWS